MIETLEMRPNKAGDVVVIKDTNIKATVVECVLVTKNTWVYTLEGWPGKILGELIETAGQNKR